MLDRPSILTVVSQLVTGGVSQHIRVDRELKAAILSRLLVKYEASENAKALTIIKKISPVAWHHVHMNGHYAFRNARQVIDLDAIVEGFDLD